MKITIAEYSPAWSRLFEQEMRLLEIALGKDTAIFEHIGSTAVVGLAAKPIIDIMVGPYDFSLADNLVPEVEALGYEYIPRYEDVMPYRRYFTKRVDGTDTHHIHMVALGSEFWERHLLFRDFLRGNPVRASEYAALKKKLAELEWNDTNQYADAKTTFIRSVEKEARGQS
jgi:GrpB-like predicted nucleotidyltransferase (UPF0157 family)